MTILYNFIKPDILSNNEILSLSSKADLDDILNFVDKNSVHTNHKLFLNQLFGNTNELSIIAEKKIAELNTSMYTYEMAPVFTCMENEVTSQLEKLLKYKNCESLFLPGGSICNIAAISSARHYYYPEIKFEGNKANLVVITTDQSHYSIDKACMLLGIGLDNLIKIKTDDTGNINPLDLENKLNELLEEGRKPFIFVGTICTTVFGVIDPIKEIGKICKKYNLWFHLDGAVGGSLIFSNKYNKLLDGLEHSDSLCFNPHKLLNINLQCSILLSNNKKNLFRESNCLEVAYLFNDDKYYDSSYDSGNKYFMCGRRPDVFKFWLVWKNKGKEHFEKLVDDIYDRASYFKFLIRDHENFELIIDNVNNITVCFKVKKNDKFLDDDEYKKLKLLLIQNNSMITYQKAKNYGNFFRICFVNSNTDKESLYLLVLNILDNIELMQ